MSTFPVTVLSGFLGAGKATLLNPIRNNREGEKRRRNTGVALVVFGHLLEARMEFIPRGRLFEIENGVNQVITL